MPLRQPPAEQPFSLIPPNWNPVSNDRVLPHLGLSNSDLCSGMLCQDLSFTLLVRSEWNRIDRLESRTANLNGQNDGFCHFDSDGFCRLTSNLRHWRLPLLAFQKNPILFFIRRDGFQKS
jgi:hypothetical protein